MAKSALREQARELRKEGLSVKEIAKKLHVSSSSTSTWVRDIPLTKQQREKLLKRELRGAEIGRFRSAEIRRERRLQFIQDELLRGKKLVEQVNEKELLLAGIALYWGEGSKKNGTIQFCNSDARMVQFFLLWLEKCFFIGRDEVTCWVGINQLHKPRIEKVRQYWSTVTDIPLTQFTGTVFIRAESIKTYLNHEDHFGTLFLRVHRPFRLYYRILGMIEGLSKFASVAQR